MRAITFRNEAVERGIELRLGVKGPFLDCGESVGELPNAVYVDRRHPLLAEDKCLVLRECGARQIRMESFGLWQPASSKYPFLSVPQDGESYKVLLLIDTISWYLPPDDERVAGVATVISGQPRLVAKGLISSSRGKSLCYLAAARIGDTLRVLTTSDTVSFLRVLPDSQGSAYVKVYDEIDYAKLPNVVDMEGSAWL